MNVTTRNAVIAADCRSRDAARPVIAAVLADDTTAVIASDTLITRDIAPSRVLHPPVQACG
jgi:hypothetical protein